DRQCQAVLDRAAGIERLDLGVEVHAVGSEPVQPDHRGAADRVEDAVVNHGGLHAFSQGGTPACHRAGGSREGTAGTPGSTCSCPGRDRCFAGSGGHAPPSTFGLRTRYPVAPRLTDPVRNARAPPPSEPAGNDPDATTSAAYRLCPPDDHGTGGLQWQRTSAKCPGGGTG